MNTSPEVTHTSVLGFVAVLVAVAIVGGSGALIPLLGNPSRNRLRTLISFGAGVLLGASFFHMLPEASDHLGRWCGLAILSGFLLLYVTEKFLMAHPCDEHDCDFHSLGLAAFFGISFHSLIDGLALGAGSMVPEVSLAIFLAIVVHKLPASLSLGAILLQSGFTRRQVVKYMLGFAATTPLGAIIAVSALRSVSHEFLSAAIGLSAGTFLAIATGDLLPRVHEVHEGRVRNLFALGCGIAIMLVSSMMESHK